jgi:hypothetical protein
MDDVQQEVLVDLFQRRKEWQVSDSSLEAKRAAINQLRDYMRHRLTFRDDPAQTSYASAEVIVMRLAARGRKRALRPPPLFTPSVTNRWSCANGTCEESGKPPRRLTQDSMLIGVTRSGDGVQQALDSWVQKETRVRVCRRCNSGKEGRSVIVAPKLALWVGTVHQAPRRLDPVVELREHGSGPPVRYRLNAVLYCDNSHYTAAYCDYRATGEQEWWWLDNLDQRLERLQGPTLQDIGSRPTSGLLYLRVEAAEPPTPSARGRS